MIVQIYEIQTPEEAEIMAALGVDHIGSVVLSANGWQQPLIRETIRTAASTNSRSSLILLYNDTNLVLRSIDYYQPDIIHFCDMLTLGKNDDHFESACAPHVELQAAVKKRFPQVAVMRSIPIPAAVNDGPSVDIVSLKDSSSRKAAKDEKTPNNSWDKQFVKSGVDAASAGIKTLARLFAPASDYFLTDTLLTGPHGTMEQPVSGFVGITGRTCDWNAAAELVRISPIPVILAGGLSPVNVYAGIGSVRPAGVDSCTLTNAVDKSGRPIRFTKDAEKVRHFVAEARRIQQPP